MAGGNTTGAVAAIATAAAGIAQAFLSDDYKHDNSEIKIPSGSSSKVTDKSAEARAAAHVKYAQQYFNSIKTIAKTNLLIATVQQAGAFYIAGLQKEVADRMQDRLDDTWKDIKDKSDKLFNHWYDVSRPIEIDMIGRAKAAADAGYTADYATVRNRAVIDTAKEFTRQRDKLEREQSAHCVGTTRAGRRMLRAAEAKARVTAINAAYRFEEARKERIEDKQRKEVFDWANQFRGLGGQGLQGASALTGIAGQQVNPYAGWASAFGNLSNFGAAWNQGTMAGFYGAHAPMQVGMQTAGLW